jgi:integrase
VEAALQGLVDRTNYLLVKDYLRSISGARMLEESSVRRYWFYGRHLLMWAMDTPLHKADRIRPLFPAYVASLISPRTRRNAPPGAGSEIELAAETQKKIIEVARGFFTWVRSNRPQEYRRLSPEWIAALRPPRKRLSRPEHVFVTLDDVLQIAKLKIPEDDLAIRRDQAAAAMLFLSGMRAGAFTTLTLEAIDIDGMRIRQWPELGVHTKNGKKATTFLFQIPELIEVALEWDRFVRKKLPAKALWYTPIDQHWGLQALSKGAPGINRGLALDKRLRLIFARAGLPYRSAHKFRHGHAVYGLLRAKTMADYKALSENMMHADIRTTDDTYAMLSSEEVKNRIAGLFAQPSNRTQGEPATSLESLPNERLSEMLFEVARRLVN